MRGASILTLLAVLLAAGTSGGATGEPAVDALIDKLVEKGIMTAEDARELATDLPEPVAAEKPAPRAPREGKQPPQEKGKLPFEIKVRAQARFDAGDLLVGSDGEYRSERDLFLRRVRLEVEKEFENPPLGKELDLNLTLEADRSGQQLRNGRRSDADNDAGLHYLYADWTFADPFALEIGKHKLPFLRVELTSSSRQLMIERPAATGAAKDSFGDYQQPHVMLHGDLSGGAFRYYLSYADGVSDRGSLQELDEDATGVQGAGWGEALIARVELAPLGFAGGGFIEKKKDDTGIGAENHLTIGVDGGFQRNVRYETDSVADAELHTRVISVDLSARYSFGNQGTVTGQAGYVAMKRDFNYREDEKPQGFFLQAGYLIPGSFLRGRLEPAVRYELFDRDRVENDGESGTKERTVGFGVNHYLVQHSIKWAYNFVHTRFDRGVAQAADARDRDVHQLLLQLYF